MGEIQNRPFQLSFNASLKVEFQGSRVTSDSGLILVRELDERLGFGELIARHLTDSRGKNAQLKACPLLLAVVGREPSDAAPVRKQAAADSGFAAAGRIGAAARRNQSGRGRGVEGGVSEKSLRNGANHGLLVLAKALPGASGPLALERMQKKIAAAATGGILSSLEKQNGNSGHTNRKLRKADIMCYAQFAVITIDMHSRARI